MAGFQVFHRFNKPRSLDVSVAQTEAPQPIAEREQPVHPGVQLRQLLEDIGMPQVRLAELLNMSRAQLNDILSCRRSLNMSTAMLLEAAFDIPAEVWIGMQNDYDAYYFLHDTKSQELYDRTHRHARLEMGKYVDAVHRMETILTTQLPSHE